MCAYFLQSLFGEWVLNKRKTATPHIVTPSPLNKSKNYKTKQNQKKKKKKTKTKKKKKQKKEEERKEINIKQKNKKSPNKQPPPPQQNLFNPLKTNTLQIIPVYILSKIRRSVPYRGKLVDI